MLEHITGFATSLQSFTLLQTIITVNTAIGIIAVITLIESSRFATGHLKRLVHYTIVTVSGLIITLLARSLRFYYRSITPVELVFQIVVLYLFIKFFAEVHSFIHRYGYLGRAPKLRTELAEELIKKYFAL